MRLNSKWNRRSFLGTVGTIASSVLSGSILAPRKLFGGNRAVGASAPVSGLGNTGNPYEELGVTTVINAEGTMTMLGGSLPHPELEAVMTMAGRHFVSIPELEVAAGKRIAEMLKLPDGYTALVTRARRRPFNRGWRAF
ncbi:MAG: hypothetical protein WCA27_15570 [Candidatus Sulfotelmatobacter sp.]